MSEDLNEKISDILYESKSEEVRRETEAQALEELAEAIRDGEDVSYTCFVGFPDGETRKLIWTRAKSTEQKLATAAMRYRKISDMIEVI